jgi:hypothetical protein
MKQTILYQPKNEVKEIKIDNTTLSNIFLISHMLYNYLLKAMCWTIYLLRQFYMSMGIYKLDNIFVVNICYIL